MALKNELVNVLQIVDGNSLWWEGSSPLESPLCGPLGKVPLEALAKLQSTVEQQLSLLANAILEWDMDLLLRALSDVSLYPHAKINLSVNTLSRLCQALYMLATDERMVNWRIVRVACDALHQFLKKNKKTLHGRLVLEHEPLVRRFMYLCFPPLRVPISPEEVTSMDSVVALCSQARKFFDGATLMRFILDDLEWKYDFQHSQVGCDELVQFVSLIAFFLPSTVEDPSLRLRLIGIFSPDSYVWSSNSNRMETLLVLIVSRLVKFDEFHRKNQLSNDWLPFLSGILFKHFRLGNGSEKTTPTLNRRMYVHQQSLKRLREHVKGTAESFAVFLAHALTRAESSSMSLVLPWMETFFHSLDTFCHPSNQGPWTRPLNEFFLMLTSHMARLHSKKSLNADVNDRFVELCWPLVTKLAFDQGTTMSALTLSGSDSLDIVKHLSFMNPTFTNGRVLEMSAKTLISLSEPHRTIACIGLMDRITRSQLESEMVPEEYFEVVGLCFDGIDANDHGKTIATLRLLITLWTCLPMNKTLEGAIGLDLMEGMVSAFLDRVFVYVEGISTTSVTSSPSNADGMLERMLTMVLGITCNLFFQQLDQSLHAFALERIANLIASPQSNVSSSVLQCLVEAVHGRFPRETCTQLLPPILEKIKYSIDVLGEGCDVTKNSHSISQLLWYLACANGLIHSSAGAAAFVLDDAQRLFDLFLRLRQRSAISLAASLMRTLFKSIAMIYPLGVANSDLKGLAMAPVTLKDVSIDWYIPGPDVLAAAQRKWSLLIESLLMRISAIDANNGHILVEFIQNLTHCGLDCDFFTKTDSTAVTKALIDTAKTESLPVDIRAAASSALLLYYRHQLGNGKAVNSIDVDMRFSNFPTKIDRQHPKQTMLPPLLQLVKVASALTGVRSLTNRPTMSHDVFKAVCDLALAGHFDAVTRPAMIIITLHSKDDPGMVRNWILNDLMPRLAKATVTDEDLLLGGMRLLQLKDIQQLFTAPPLAWSIISHLSTLLLRSTSLASINQLQAFLKYSIIGYADVSFSRSDPEGAKSLFTAATALFRSCGSSHSIQLSCLLFLTSFSYSTLDVHLLRDIGVFLLNECFFSEDVDVRSVALNRCITLLHRLVKLSNDDMSLSDDWDRYPPQTKIGVRPLTNDFISLRDRVPALVKILSLDANEEAIPKYRTDPSEFFQSMMEAGGIVLIPDLLTSLSAALQSGRLADERTLCEVGAGILRSLLLVPGVSGGETEESLSSVVQWFVKAAVGGSVEMKECWYEAGRFLASNLRSCQCHLLMHTLTSALEQHRAKSSSCAVLLHLASGMITALLPGDAIPFGNVEDATYFAQSEFDLVRQSYALFTLRRLAHGFKYHSISPSAPINSINYQKTLMLIVEGSSWNPITTSFWSLVFLETSNVFSLLVGSCEAGNVEVQKSAERLFKLLGGVGFVPASMVPSIIEIVFKTVNERPSTSLARKTLLQFIKVFHHRNLSRMISYNFLFMGHLMPLLADGNVDVAMEASKIVSSICHCSHDLAAKLSSDACKQLSSCRLTIRDASNLRSRQAAILLTLALTESCPYSVPPWLPALLEAAVPFLADRSPVSTTVTRLFSEFKRTHGDTWHEDRELFTPDQLESISELLVAPSYYA